MERPDLPTGSKQTAYVFAIFNVFVYFIGKYVNILRDIAKSKKYYVDKTYISSLSFVDKWSKFCPMLLKIYFS